MITEYASPQEALPQAVLTQAISWSDKGAGAALVVVMRTWSSAPDRPGSMFAIDRAGRISGSVPRGVARGPLVEAARAALIAGSPGKFSAAITDEAAQAARLPCGGSIEMRIEPLVDSDRGNVPLLREAVFAMAQRRSVVLCTRLSDSSCMLIRVDEDAAYTELAAEAIRAAAADSTRITQIENEPVLFHVFNAPLRLFIIGAVHIAQALAVAARPIGFDVTVIDPRPGFATPQRFPGVACLTDEPGLALRMATLDRRSAVVTLSHDAAVDDPALVKALNSKAFYVGALGSRKTHKARLKRLHEDAKLPERTTARLHGPAGLAIGAIGPAEIAASIVAEIIAELRGEGRTAVTDAPPGADVLIVPG